MSEQGAVPPHSGDEQAVTSQQRDNVGSAPTAASATPEVSTTRTAIAWWALGFSLLLLILVLVFVLQNLSSVSTSFFSVKWTIPLGLDLLLASVLGGVIAFLLGAARMVQLRRIARRRTRTSTRV
jgi:uncharacterized integral membrane protein